MRKLAEVERYPLPALASNVTKAFKNVRAASAQKYAGHASLCSPVVPWSPVGPMSRCPRFWCAGLVGQFQRVGQGDEQALCQTHGAAKGAKTKS